MSLLLPFSLVLLLAGVMLLWFSHRWSRQQFWGKLFISLGTGILLIANLPYSALLLTTSLERDNPPLHAAPTDLGYVVVLGGGHRSDPYLPPREQLYPASYYRVMEEIMLMQANPGAILMLSGYGASAPFLVQLAYTQ